jgi:hypothetical protein
MSTQAADDRKTNDVNHTNMIHIVLLANPYLALCGARLRGEILLEAETECAVCAELDQTGWW